MQIDLKLLTVSVDTMFLLLVVCLIAALWGYSQARGQYWRRRGVPHEHSWPLLGSRSRFYFLQENVFEYTERIYWKHNNAVAVGLDTGHAASFSSVTLHWPSIYSSPISQATRTGVLIIYLWNG